MSYKRFNVISAEFGEVLLLVGVDGDTKVFRLVDPTTQKTLALGSELGVDCVDSGVYRDENYLYLTSYCCEPVRTVSVELNGCF